MREEEDCLYWPVKYSSNEAGVGREVGQEMESPQGKEHHSSGDTREGRALQTREEGNVGGKEIFLLCGSWWLKSQI